LREALRRHLDRLASETDAERWNSLPLDDRRRPAWLKRAEPSKRQPAADPAFWALGPAPSGAGSMITRTTGVRGTTGTQCRPGRHFDQARTIGQVASGFVVMSGLPASGKTTLGRQLGTRLRLVVLDKDDYLESLLAEQDSVDPDLRSALSREADLLLERDVRNANDGAVIVSFWRRPELSNASGTPTQWLLSLDGLTEVYCDCPPSPAADRFVARQRHPGHGDARRRKIDLIEQFEAVAAFGPLGLGRTLVIDTSTPVDPDQVVALVDGH
jgi:AAA domain